MGYEMDGGCWVLQQTQVPTHPCGLGPEEGLYSPLRPTSGSQKDLARVKQSRSVTIFPETNGD